MPELLRDETLSELFAETVLRDPTRIAVRTSFKTLTYGELDLYAERLAAGLREKGARAGRFVGIWLPRGMEVLAVQIAVAKTGAAWVPFDSETPPERIETCLEDVGAIGIVTSTSWQGRLPVTVDAFAWETLASAKATSAPSGARAYDPAYVIYTSGSTGMPKGIVVSNANVCHFLRAAAKAYDLRPDDVMLQASSIAFDLSLEEIWLPYHVGACLAPCPPEVLTDPERLVQLIGNAGVTVIDVVPTLLALLPAELPTVRLIIVGGEACPPSIVERFATSGRRLINSYGPSEATVVATTVELLPGRPVTIGRPLANVSCYVVGEGLEMLDRGAEGELLIGGPGIAAGYINRPDLTAGKFIRNQFCTSAEEPILYRSGDAVVMTVDGDLIFRGRIDDQVKLRGFRIELGEIERELERLPCVAQAAVVIAQTGGVDRLVAFVVTPPDQRMDEAETKKELAAHLPPYMVPSAIEVIDDVPRLAASGKVDRKALASFASLQPVDEDVPEPPVSATEATLRAICHELLPGRSITPDADFFFDLGGHSLIAAQLVSAARKLDGLEHMTLGQLYAGRTLRAVAALVDQARPPADAGGADDVGEDSYAVSRRRILCGMAQALVMPLLLTLQAAPWLAIFISYSLISPENASLGHDIALVFVAFAVINLAIALLAIAAKWLIVGRSVPGRYPLWGVYYFRIWLVQRILSLVHLKWMQNSPILPAYLRLLGARIGKGASISDFDAGAVDLLDIGANVSTGSKVVFANARISGTSMIVGQVWIGDDASLGSSCAVEGDVTIGAGAEIGDLSALAHGMEVPARETWEGSPAAYVAKVDARPFPAAPNESPLGKTARGAAYLAMLLTLPGITIVPIVPAFHLMDWLDTFINPVLGVSYLWYMPVLALSASAAMIVATLMLTVAARWIILPRVRPGRYPVAGGFYMRRWAVGLLTEAALDTLSSLFATLYMRAWYRLMGSKIGRGTEISTSFAGRYELIELGKGNFIADDVVLGDERLRDGWLELERTKTGDQVFIGNEAVVPQGYVIGDGALIGVKSRPPEGVAVEAGSTWFGSPAMHLPQRQRFKHDENQTFYPAFRKKVGRALFEAFNISLPTALFISLVTAVMEILAPVFDRQNWASALWMCVLASVVIAFVQLLIAIGYKWLLMGRYRPTMRPMWSWWALKTEAVAVMYWGMAGKAMLDLLRGTPFLPVVLRLFGTRTGRGIYLDSADITEFDCVTIGDGAVVNNHACLQTHLYEDRLMKVGLIVIGSGAVIGANSTVLYDTVIGEGAVLGPLTLVMKGESIRPGARFTGSPAGPVSDLALPWTSAPAGSRE